MYQPLDISNSLHGNLDGVGLQTVFVFLGHSGELVLRTVGKHRALPLVRLGHVFDRYLFALGGGHSLYELAGFIHLDVVAAYE